MILRWRAVMSSMCLPLRNRNLAREGGRFKHMFESGEEWVDSRTHVRHTMWVSRTHVRWSRIVVSGVILAGVVGSVGARWVSPSPDRQAQAVPVAQRIYVVQAGDTVWGIARWDAGR